MAQSYGDPSTLGTSTPYGSSALLPATNELPVDITKAIQNGLTGLAPMTTILQRLGNDKASNFRIDWQEAREVPHTVTVSTTESSASTTVYFQSGGMSLVDDTLLYNPRVDDIRRVNGAVSSDTDITVAISQGGKTSTAWKAGDVVHVMLPVVPENDEAYRTSSVPDANVYNYNQLVRLQYGITRTMNALSTHFGGAGSKRQQLKQQKFREFRIKWEKTLYFGGRATINSTAATAQRLMGGMNHYLRDGTLYKDFNGIITESGWDDFLLSYYEENPDTTEVTAFVAPNVWQKISSFGKDKVRLNPGRSKAYGLEISTYYGVGFSVNLVPLPLLNDSETRGWGWILDLGRIRMRNLESPMFYPEAKNVGEGEIIYDTYRVLTSLMIANEARHAMFVGADL